MATEQPASDIHREIHRLLRQARADGRRIPSLAERAKEVELAQWLANKPEWDEFLRPQWLVRLRIRDLALALECTTKTIHRKIEKKKIRGVRSENDRGWLLVDLNRLDPIVRARLDSIVRARLEKK